MYARRSGHFQGSSFKKWCFVVQILAVFKDLFHDIYIHVQPLNKCHDLVLSFTNILIIAGNPLLWQIWILLVVSQPVRTRTALFKIPIGFQNDVSGHGHLTSQYVIEIAQKLIFMIFILKLSEVLCWLQIYTFYRQKVLYKENMA